jgi:SAM-dependent methyltransferase
MTQLKHRIMRRLSATVPGECLSLLASNAWRSVKRPVYPSSIRLDQFDSERQRLWRHLHHLLPLAGFEAAESALDDRDVLVIGVGSTFGFALLLLSLGARRVVCIDPFLRNTDRRAEERFAEHLVDSIPWATAKARAVAHLERARRGDAGQGFLVDGRDLRFHQVALETTGGVLDRDAPFDLIISNAVLEHLMDVDVAMRRLKDLLAPGGGMAHAFGFMNHTLFDRVHSQHYLTFSPLMWRLMTSNGSPPNRVSLSGFRRAVAAAGLTEAKFVVTERYSSADTEYALRHAHRSVVADNADDMSALHVVLAMPRTA